LLSKYIVVSEILGLQGNLIDSLGQFDRGSVLAAEVEEARSLVTEVLEIDPEFSATSWAEGCFEANENITNLLITNLSKAGLPN
jgi:hypothetical protein